MPPYVPCAPSWRRTRSSSSGLPTWKVVLPGACSGSGWPRRHNSGAGAGSGEADPLEALPRLEARQVNESPPRLLHHAADLTASGPVPAGVCPSFAGWAGDSLLDLNGPSTLRALAQAPISSALSLNR